jgi:hypothetical protein
MNEISSSDRTSTIIIPVPIDLFTPFIKAKQAEGDRPDHPEA